MIKPASWARTDNRSKMVLKARLLSLECREKSARTAGMKHKQFVNMAPFMTSNDGNITKTRVTTPTVCSVSAIKT